MRKSVYIIAIFFLLTLIQFISHAHEKVTVIPLYSKKPVGTGNAKFYNDKKWNSESNLNAGAGAHAGPVAPVTKTGVAISADNGTDGNLQKGVEWPVPRFSDNNDGTITDNLTGLVWLKSIACDGNTSDFPEAVDFVASLQDGDCGLNDGSEPGDWRIPNIKEIQSLFRYGAPAIILPDTRGTSGWSNADPFVLSKEMSFFDEHLFRTSTITDNNFYVVSLKDGRVEIAHSDSDMFANWPVRD